MIEYKVEITESRLQSLLDREKESESLFEKIVTLYTADFLSRQEDEKWRDNYNESIAEFVNLSIIRDCVIFNQKVPNIWFNGMGHGSMMYWAYKDSKVISGIDTMINNAR